MAGIAAVTGIYPMQVFKTNYLVKPNKGQIELFKEILKTEGYKGFWKGYSFSLVSVAPWIALRMASFDWLKKYSDKFENKVIFNAMAGATAGAIATSVTYPSDVVRKMLHIGDKNEKI